MMKPGSKGRLTPEVMDEFLQFLDSQGMGEGEASAAEGGGAEPAAVAVEIETKPTEGGSTCPHCGKAY